METFKEFKKEIIARCKEAHACESEFKRLLKTTNFKELVEVLTDNFNWVCNNNIIDESINQLLNQFDVFVNMDAVKGFIFFDKTVDVNLPKHTTGTVNANNATTVNLPKHTEGYVWADNATTVNLPKHTTGNVCAPNCKINNQCH